MIYEYPALFSNDGGKVAFHFYDIEGLHSFGDDLDEAVLAAEEILADYLLEWERERPNYLKPEPSPAVAVLANAKRLEVFKMIRVDTDKYAAELAAMDERAAILNADNPIRELLDRKHMKIKQLADLLEAPYRTVQDWSLGKSKPPQWTLNLILDKALT